MTSLIETALSGVLIGILVSAPMGPVGILCIRRTIHRGGKAGLITGIGAAFSDITYAAMTYLGASFAVSFMEQHEIFFRIFGSLLILFFSVYLYTSAPIYDTPDSEKSKAFNSWQLLVSSFGLTLLNPFIIVFFIALYSRFNFIQEGGNPWLRFAWAMFFIAMGAMIWWTATTTLVTRFKEKATLSGMRLFNRIVALLFMLVAIVGLISGLFPSLIAKLFGID